MNIDHRTQRGVIQGDDGEQYPFRRGRMVLWLDFDRLRVGSRVRFTPQFGHAINVERIAVRQ